MANRLTRIYTRTGDDGRTTMATGERVSKTNRRIEACGSVDETNCAIGVVLGEENVPTALRESLSRIQNELFDLGAELSLPDHIAIHAEHVLRLEQELDELNSVLPPLKEFILPGGGQAGASCHMARAICRRCERVAWALAAEVDLNHELLKYLNRLSDLLFVAARILTQREGATEVSWRSDRSRL